MWFKKKTVKFYDIHFFKKNDKLSLLSGSITLRAANQGSRGTFSQWGKTDSAQHQPSISKSHRQLTVIKSLKQLPGKEIWSPRG